MKNDFSAMKGKTIVVTGGAGFIGSNLTQALLDAGVAKVTVLDDFSTGKHENLAEFADDPRFVLIEGDIRNFATCCQSVKGADIVFHEAALGSVPRSVEDPMTTSEVNVTGFVNMLKAAVDAKVGRFVYASSSAVYGDDAELPKIEERIGKALSPYAISKYTNELFAENFHDLYGIDAVGLRYFNVFGPKQDPAGAYAAVIPCFAATILQHRSPVVNGDGSFSRDFTYIDNVVEANFLAALTQNPASLNISYNVAAGKATTLLELFVALKKELAKFDPETEKVELIFGPERAGDIPHSLADISRAVRLLNYNPSCSAQEGFARAAEWYFKNYGGNNAS
ncbi:MAG: SDR family NAD(P)-dependent oxidoreductase [Victivallales bacterium]|jgi:UDP-N-acetylglucosamine 4-epimerase|nr:SDR family NAD(P)-dependent oxidoreductase [Victivallales bacterium]